MCDVICGQCVVGKGSWYVVGKVGHYVAGKESDVVGKWSVCGR